MSDKMIENNQVTIMGEVATPFTFSHEVFGEGFYMVSVNVRRLSNSMDRIPLMISERLIDVSRDYTGEFIMASGQFRSYNRHEEHKNRLVLSLFVREVAFIEEELDGAKTNQIFLDGYICKAPVYRKTPLGREIADLLIAVNICYFATIAVSWAGAAFFVHRGDARRVAVSVFADFRSNNIYLGFPVIQLAMGEAGLHLASNSDAKLTGLSEREMKRSSCLATPPGILNFRFI